MKKGSKSLAMGESESENNCDHQFIYYFVNINKQIILHADGLWETRTPLLRNGNINWQSPSGKCSEALSIMKPAYFLHPL